MAFEKITAEVARDPIDGAEVELTKREDVPDGYKVKVVLFRLNEKELTLPYELNLRDRIRPECEVRYLVPFRWRSYDPYDNEKRPGEDEVAKRVEEALRTLGYDHKPRIGSPNRIQ